MSLGPLMISLEGPSLETREREWLASPLVGGVILFTRNYVGREQLQDLVGEIHALRNPPLLIAVDQEGGRVQRFGEPFSSLPAARVLGHLFDRDPSAAEEGARAMAWLMAAELRAVGVDLSFAPVVDLELGLADVVGDRALHSDPEVVAHLALCFNASAKEAGMAATAKHFPSHAGAKSDSHTEIAVDRRNYDQLFDDLQPYRRLIDARLLSIMVAHVIFPELDPLPASMSSWWIDTQLRGELGFSGAVISDDVSMAGAAVVGGVTERVIKSLEAGCDLVLVCNAPDGIPDLLSALSGYVNPSAQLRLMRLRGRLGTSWDELCSSVDWREAREVVANLSSRPKLELQG